MKTCYVAEVESTDDPVSYFSKDNTTTLGQFDTPEPALALLLVVCEGWRWQSTGGAESGYPDELTSLYENQEMNRWARVRKVEVPG